MKKNIWIAGMALLVAGLFSAFMLKKPETKHQIVFQLSSKDTLTHKGFIKQLNNVLDGMEAEVEVVVHGPGISFMKRDNGLDAPIEKLHSRGIKFLVCRNTMKVKNVRPEELYPFAEIVPMGIGHIVKRQEAGWSYIKAGF